jgi:hypothetical protein
MIAWPALYPGMNVTPGPPWQPELERNRPFTGIGLSIQPWGHRPERAHVLGLEQTVAEVATGRAEHQLEGVRRIDERAFDDVGEVRRELGDARNNALSHDVGGRALLLVRAGHRQVHRKHARGVLAGGANSLSNTLGICRPNDGFCGTSPRRQPS